jgi:hypothetical protein
LFSSFLRDHHDNFTFGQLELPYCDPFWRRKNLGVAEALQEQRDHAAASGD